MNRPLFDFQSSMVAITGGANGIGEALVRAFHGAGAEVCFCDVDVRNGRRLARALGARVEFQRVDLLREPQVKRWIAAIGRKRKRIDVLVNNAAYDPRIPLGQCTVATWDALMARNLRAYFLTARESVTWLKPGAAIINLASITFHIAPARMTAYVATKAAIIGLTRSLARELGPKRIRVNTLSPGWIMTARQLRQHVTPSVKRMLRRVQCIPDLNQPEEVADVALFLASHASRAVTGQEILVDRGWAHS